MLNEEQVAEMVRLRVEEQLTQRQIAQRMGVTLHSVVKSWLRVPLMYRSSLLRRRARGGRTMMFPPAVLGGQCSRCGWLFDEQNPCCRDGICRLCVLQEEGRVVLYRGGARDTTQAIRSGRCCLPDAVEV